MATWLILVVTSLVLAVIGATTEAAWLLAVSVLVLVVGIFWAVTGRRARSHDAVPVARDAQRGGR